MRILLLCMLLMMPVSCFAEINNSPIQGLHQDIQSQMEDEEKQLLPSMEVLWRATLEHNTGLQLALQKLAEKSGAVKDKAKFAREVLQTIVQAGGMGASVALANPAPMIGSSVINRITTPDTTAQKLQAVNGADLVVLAKEVEQAQDQLILNYMQYRQSVDELGKIQQSLDTMQQQSQTIPTDYPQTAGILRSLALEETLQKEQTEASIARYRNVLVLSCGEPAVIKADQMLAKQSHTHDRI